nr:cytochrome c-like domain protein [Cedratvirus borely]WIL03803.1 hypothetical protein Cplu_249 [Cedratvirus plubellavi]
MSFCLNLGVPRVTVHIPCSSPSCSCSKPPSGPNTCHLGNIPYTNAQVHLDADTLEDAHRRATRAVRDPRKY